MPLRGRGHLSKVSACLVSTNSPLTKLLGPQWRVKWFGNKERLVLPLSLTLSLLHTHARTHTQKKTHAPIHISQGTKKNMPSSKTSDFRLMERNYEHIFYISS